MVFMLRNNIRSKYCTNSSANLSCCLDLATLAYYKTFMSVTLKLLIKILNLIKNFNFN